MSLEAFLRDLESDESISLEAVADALVKRWPSGVVIAVAERDAESDTTTMRYAWRKSYYASLGMVTAMRHLMLTDGEDGSDAD